MPWLVGPLLTGEGIQLVKSFTGGRCRSAMTRIRCALVGRVTELVARPLLAARCGRAGLCTAAQLSGEPAGELRHQPLPRLRRGDRPLDGARPTSWAWTQSPRSAGAFGRTNRPRRLGAMSRQVIATLLSRCGIPDSGVGLTQFLPGPDDSDYTRHTWPVSLVDRPMMKVCGRADRHRVGALGQDR